MDKLVKSLVVVLLVLSAFSLVLGLMLFQRREVLKGRTQRLEQTAERVAGNLRMDDFRMAALQVDRAEDVPNMQPMLDRLAAHAANTYETLQETEDALAAEKTQHERTQRDLATARNDLEASRRQVANLQSDLEARRVEIAQLTGRVGDLEQEKTALEGQVQDLNEALARKDEENHDLRDQLATAESTISSLERELGDTVRVDIPEGLSGAIALVRPEWNFVVLNIGRNEGLVPNAEMMVHRDNELIGKVLISNVADDMAIAEILSDWQRQPIQEGDHVLF